jgi:hypothetical protein
MMADLLLVVSGSKLLLHLVFKEYKEPLVHRARTEYKDSPAQVVKEPPVLKAQREVLLL